MQCIRFVRCTERRPTERFAGLPTVTVRCRSTIERLPATNRENMATLSEKLKTKRTEKGKSLDALAKEAGLSKSYLWELENRDSPRPSLDKLQAIAAALDIDVAFFMDESIEDLQEDLKDRQFFRNYSKLKPETKEQLRVILEALKKTAG